MVQVFSRPAKEVKKPTEGRNAHCPAPMPGRHGTGHSRSWTGTPECRCSPWADFLPSVWGRKRQVGGMSTVLGVAFGPFLLQRSLTHLLYSSPPIAQEKTQNLGRGASIPSETSPHNWCPMKRVRKDPGLKSYKIGSPLRATGCASCFLLFAPTEPTQRLS